METISRNSIKIIAECKIRLEKAKEKLSENTRRTCIRC